jgi:subfamily B ATP-binding cassette protein MsbA
MKPLPRVLSYTKPYWKVLIFSLITASLFGIVSAIPTYVLKHTIDDIFIKRYSHLIMPFLLAFIAVFILKGIFMYLSSYSMHWVNNKVTIDIRNDLFLKIIHLPTSFYQSNSTGQLMSHFLNDVQMIQQAAGAAIRDGIRSFFEALCLVGFAIYQNASLGFLLLIIAPFIGYTIKKLGRARKNASTAIQSQLGHISAMLQETFIGIREIKAFNAEEVEQARFKNLLHKCFGAIMHNIHIECILPALVEAIAVSGCGVIFYMAAHQVLDGTITAGQLTAFVAAVILAYQPLKKIINVYSEVQYGLAAAERIFVILDQVYPATQNRSVILTTFKRSIAFKDVSFSYTPTTPVLSHVTITIERGQTVGLIGPSGCGKSTFCDILLGFINPTTGIVSIDGTDITTINFASLRNTIGYVGQRTFLFNDTVLRNVAYARPDAPKKEIIQACKAAHAHEFIEMLPNGYDTIVGENGTLLSGGQKQRLTIARALLKNPEFLVFDEATSALDEESERLIRLAIDELRGEKTILIVSHRPSMLHNLDHIFEISHGSIKDIKNHFLGKQQEF